MSDFRTALRTTLESDTVLMTLLTGGVWDASELPRDGGGESTFSRETDGVRLKPIAVIRFRASSVYSANLIGAERGTLELYFYQDIGYDVIEQAITRAKTLLNHVFITADDRALAQLEYDFTSGDVPGAELSDAACRFMRFAVYEIRK